MSLSRSKNVGTQLTATAPYFMKRSDKHLGAMKTSIEQARASRRKWYLNNKEKAINRVRERKAELRAWLSSYRETLSCKECGENDIACLDFHHTDPSMKDISISKVVTNGWSKERILLEIEKCDVLCSNCHRKFHYYS